MIIMKILSFLIKLFKDFIDLKLLLLRKKKLLIWNRIDDQLFHGINLN